MESMQRGGEREKEKEKEKYLSMGNFSKICTKG
jgi:hypothetical protein